MDQTLTFSEENEQAPKPKQYDEDGNLKVSFPGGKVATLRELNGNESMNADDMVGGSPSPIKFLKTYALFGLVTLTVNGEQKTLPPPINDQNIKRRAQLFTARELTALMAEYSDEYMGDLTDGEDLKN